MASLKEQFAKKKQEKKLKHTDIGMLVESHLRTGILHLQKKNYDLALNDYNQVIRLNSKNAIAYFSRGFCYENQENYEFAIKDYDEAIKLDPNNTLAYLNRGNCYKAKEDYTLALENYDKAIKLTPDCIDVYANRGYCYEQQKNYALALKNYNEAIRLNPDDGLAYFNRGFCYVALYNYELASNDFSKSIEYLDSLEDKKDTCLLVSSVFSVADQYAFAIVYAELAFTFADSKEQQHKDIYIENITKQVRLDRANKELEEKNKRLELEIQQKEAVEKRMQKLVEQFTHSLGNVIFPDTIYQVAERLKNLPECRRDTLLLHEAYHAEIIIKLQAELLRQRYSNTNPEKFRLMIRNCRRNANAGEKTKTIEAILNYAVSRVTARFLNQHYAGLETIRNKILTQTNTDLNQLKQKFEDDILLHNDDSNPLKCVEWVSQNLRPIQITQISPLWKKVFILSDSYAEALLFGYFSEILFNAFKYADHESDEFLTLSFAEETINEDIYLSCNWSNPATHQKLSGLGTNQGLEAIAEDLKQLNSTEKPEQSLLICQQDNQFQVTLFFKKDLLIDESNQLKIKRPVNRVEQA